MHRKSTTAARLCSGFKVHTNADIPARVRLTGIVWLTPSERTTDWGPLKIKNSRNEKLLFG